MRGWQGRWVEAEREYKIKIKLGHAENDRSFPVFGLQPSALVTEVLG
jgi:hypothetical protein